jgi:hypothetical protein
MQKPVKRILAAILALALMPAGFLLSGQFLDRRALHEATGFCSLVSVGESFSAVTAKAKKSAASLEEWPPRVGGEERYVVRFSGFLANASYCEISVAQKEVQAKFVESAFW